MEGQATGYPNDVMGINNQFVPFRYPTPGYSAVKMLYKFGSSQFGTMTNTNRWVKMYQDESIEFVANQSIWNEGEVRFADIVLPACTNFERWDIGEWANSGGYLAHCQTQLNHRVITLQHKCIEPVGESKSDYQIYLDLAKRLGMSALYSEGMTELDWCKRIFDGSDISSHISWSKFLRKGYYVVPAEKPALRAPVSYRWFYEGRKKDVPEPHPLPADYSGEWLDGLQTQSGKFEFIPESLKKIDDPDRPPLNRYIPSWEGTSSKDILEKYPIQLLSVHPRYSFHTQADGKDATTNDIKGHRILVNGHYYLTCRINARDAAKRNIRNNDLIRIYNDRGAVICAAVITARIREGVAHTYESSAVYDPIGRPGESADRGGCVNLLTPSRSQIQGGHSMGPNACLIQIERWPGSVAAKSQQMAEAPAK
jgi:trimethylamine-N-oxide reductase (cytochrome c)